MGGAAPVGGGGGGTVGADESLRCVGGTGGGACGASEYGRGGRTPGKLGRGARAGGLRPGIAGADDGNGKPGRPPVGFAGACLGGTGALGFCTVSLSDRYGELLFAPVSIPPAFFLNFGMPPANIPASCGGASAPLPPPPKPPPESLELLGLFAPTPPGIGGTPKAGRPGTAGAVPRPPLGAAELVLPATCGPDRSFVTAFFSLIPFEISPSRAPLPAPPPEGGGGRPPGGGGGGGPPPKPGAPKPGGGGGGGGAGMVCIAAGWEG